MRWSSTGDGTTVDGGELDGIPDAVEAARGADIAILVLGDRAGMFGRGTSGEGCDAPSLRLPGAQQELLDAVLASGTPTAVVLLAGRPYALGGAPSSAAAILEAFFPGEEGTPAIAGILSGRVNPSGRLPVSVPADPGAQPSTYLAPPLAARSEVSNIDPTAAFAFGHGLGYSAFVWDEFAASAEELGTDGELEVSVRVDEHRRPRRGRCRAALPARSGRQRGAAGAAADRIRAGWSWMRVLPPA